MKKIFFAFLCAVFAMNMANAQYYFSTYGSFPDLQYCNSGITTRNTPGYMLVGWETAVGGQQSTNVVWTDLSGSITSPYFNQTFVLNAGAIYNSRGTDVVENVNNHFYVVGWVLINGTYYPYLMELDNTTGAVLNCTVYPFANSTVQEKVMITTVNNGSGEMYIVSHSRNTLGDLSIIAFRVNQAGTPIWANVYDVLDSQNQIQSFRAMDMIESPWTPQVGPSKELYVFGYSQAGATGTMNPTVMIIDGGTGALPPVPVIQHQHGVDAWYASCDVSKSTGGFVAAGTYNNGGINDKNALVTNMNPLGVTNWTYTYDSGLYPGEYNEGNGVKERMNSNFAYETYTAGMLYDIPSAMYYAQVLKIDNTGNLVDEFIVSTGRFERPMQVDLAQGSNGLAIFGSLGTASTGSNMFTSRMYFDGTACYETTYHFNANPADISIVYPPAAATTLFVSSFNLNVATNLLQAQEDCSNPASLGSNTLAPISTSSVLDEPASLDISQAADFVTIGNTGAAESTLGLTLRDLAGKQVYQGSTITANGLANIDLAALKLTRGVYMLTVETEGKTASKKVFIH